MKMKFQNLSSFWKKLRKYWTNRFHIIIRNEKNLSDVFKLILKPRKIFVLGTSIFLLIIMFTAMLIAFTPLRVYVPGYTNPAEYNLYRKMLTRVDSVERVNAMQKVYLDNFYKVLNEIVVFEEMNAPVEGAADKRVKDKNRAEQAKKEVDEAVEQLMFEIADRDIKSHIPLSQQIFFPTFTFTMPSFGTITKPFSIPNRHFGIDIESELGTLITAIADGVIVSITATEKEGNTIVIQHSGNIISIYKNIDTCFKKPNDKVKSGDPIATMGRKGTESLNPYLHFEIWYNGAPINPLTYFVGN
jgi:murein DD-endopeptidase MepM/ murein hydrolase activator NlpD